MFWVHLLGRGSGRSSEGRSRACTVRGPVPAAQATVGEKTIHFTRLQHVSKPPVGGNVAVGEIKLFLLSGGRSGCSWDLTGLFMTFLQKSKAKLNLPLQDEVSPA